MDASTLSTDAGSIAAVVDSLLCGLVGKRAHPRIVQSIELVGRARCARRNWVAVDMRLAWLFGARGARTLPFCVTSRGCCTIRGCVLGKIVARMEENSKRLVGDEFDRAGVGCGLV